MRPVASLVIQDEAPSHYRALVVTPHAEGARIDVILDDDVRLELSVAELNFLIRSASAIPPHLLDEARDMVQPAPTHASPAQGADAARADARARAASSEAAPAQRVDDLVKPARHGKRWEDGEEERLVLGLRSGKSLDALSEEFGRSKGSVIARLVACDAVEVVPKLG